MWRLLAFENSCSVLRVYDICICIGVGRILNIGSTAFERLYILRGMHRGFRLSRRLLGLDICIACFVDRIIRSTI
jgi:hypothetical protein